MNKNCTNIPVRYVTTNGVAVIDELQRFCACFVFVLYCFRAYGQ